MSESGVLLPMPRSYWADVTDAKLAAARDTYRRVAGPGGSHEGDVTLLEAADAIDDDLVRRAAWRAAFPEPSA